MLRVKGMLSCTAEEPARIVQAVRQTYELTDAATREPGVGDETRIVLIGRFLDAARLEQTLADCLDSRH